MKKTLLKLCSALTLMISVNLISSCSTQSTAMGGGSDLPNGKVANVEGVTIKSDSTPVKDCKVIIRQVILTPHGDSVMNQQSVYTDSVGHYAFYDVKEGVYTVFCELGVGDTAAILQNIVVPDSGAADKVKIVLHPCAEFIGHILLPPGADYRGLYVFIPGTQRSVPVDSQGMFLFPQVPRGRYDLGFAYGGIANFTRVATDVDSQKTIYLRDFEFAMMNVMGDGSYTGAVYTYDNAYFVSPKFYPPNQTPDWYKSVNVNNVKYYRYDSGEFHPWVSEPLNHYYDLVLNGTATRVQNGDIILTTQLGEIFRLTGEKIMWVDSNRYTVVVACKVHVNSMNGEPVFEVIEFKIFPS